MKKLKTSNIPVELEDREVSIFILEYDIDLLKKLGKEVIKNYPDYQVVACDNAQDFRDELINHRVSVFIISLSNEDLSSGLDLIRSVRRMSLYSHSSVMVMATREVLEQNSSFLETMDTQLIPKAIRMPYFMGVLQSCLSRENTVEVEVLELIDGEILFNEGDRSENIYITKSGELEVFQHKDNDDFVIGIVGPHEVVGEMAFLNNDAHSASVRARGKCKVIVIQVSSIQHYVQSQPFWLKMILGSLMKRIEFMNDRVKEFSD